MRVVKPPVLDSEYSKIDAEDKVYRDRRENDDLILWDDFEGENIKIPISGCYEWIVLKTAVQWVF